MFVFWGRQNIIIWLNSKLNLSLNLTTLCYRKQEYRTKTAWNTLHPSWNETHHLNITAYFAQSFTVSVRDVENVTHSLNEELGRVSIPVAVLPVNQAQVTWYSLGALQGHLQIKTLLRRAAAKQS